MMYVADNSYAIKTQLKAPMHQTIYVIGCLELVLHGIRKLEETERKQTKETDNDNVLP